MLLKVLMVLKVALFSTHVLLEDENKALQSYNKWNSEHMQAAFDYFNSRNDKELENAERKLRDEMVEFNFETFQNKSLIRYMKMMTNIGDAALSPHNLENIEEAIGGMFVSFSDFKVPKYKSKDPNEVIDSFPKIDFIMRNCRDPDELKYYWECWYDSVGRNAKDNYFKYSKLRNDAAKLNDFWSGAEVWLSRYEDDNFENDMESFLNQLMPLYKQLHAYTRHKLNTIYGEFLINSTGPIPVHLWGRLSAVEIMLPYDDDATVDVDLEMNKQNYNARKMFDMAEEFYVSLNLSKLPDDFYQNSIIEKTIDRENLLCFPQTFENLDGKFHVSMCTQIKFKDFLTIHHELGHIQYYQQYHHQPLVFREAANPGFNEAIGGFITLAVATPKHLKKVGLLQDNFLFDDKSQINYLMQNALMKFIDLPTVYAISMFQFGIFRGEIISKNANTKYWEMHRKYGGVVPPAPRTNEDFDAGGIYHVANDVENLRYFVAGILQFQLYKSACIKANEYEPGNPEKLLHNCDFHGNTDVGNSLKAMLQLGSSKPWPDALEIMTGQRKLDISPMLEYFKPLEEWLIKENKQNGVTIGWE